MSNSDGERDARGWRFSQYYAGADCDRNRQDVDIEIDSDNDIVVACREGSRYSEQSTRVYIPIDVMIRIMRQAGYDVTPNDGETQG
jgi:hypothetical protein